MSLGALRSRSRRAVGLAAAVLVLGLTGGGAAAAGLALAADDARAATLTLRAATVRAALDSAMQRYADTVHDLAAVAASSPAPAPGSPSGAASTSAAAATGTASAAAPTGTASASLPAPTGTASASLPAPEAGSLAEAVERIAGERLAGAHQVLIVDADLRVLAQHAADGSTPPAASRLTPEPELARAMELAEQHGRLVASLTHVLPSDAGLPAEQRQAGFEMAAPVRSGTLRGWVIVSVRAADLLDAALRAGAVTGVSAELTETFPDGVVHDVARWAPSTGAISTVTTGGAADAVSSGTTAGGTAGGGTAGGGRTGGGSVRRIELPIAGHTWHVLVRPTTPLIGPWRAAAAPATLTGTVLVSFGLAILVLASGAERRRAEEAVRETADATERARVAEEMRRRREDELAGFATTASEQLHAPLHTIAGFTELLLEDAARGLDEESRGFLLRIDGATRRMLTIVNELLTYAMAGDSALKPEPVEASLLALDVAAAHLPGPSIEIGELPAIAGDAALLRQVLDQLIANAVRFVRHGTPARIGVSAREEAGGWWRIEVSDRGIGVPEDQRTRIFEPFHRTPAAEGYPGTGLGLAVCARIVALHGGAIGVEPNPGGGSTFWFTVAGAETGTRELALSGG